MEKSLIVVSCCSHKAHHENSFMIFFGGALLLAGWTPQHVIEHSKRVILKYPFSHEITEKTFWNTVVAGLLHTVVQKLLHFKRPQGIIKTSLQNISFNFLQCVVKYLINKSHNFVESGMQESKKPRN